MSGSKYEDQREEFSTLFSNAGWTSRIAPHEVIERWCAFGADCIDGFPWDIEDYLNDVTMRSALEEVEDSFRDLDPIGAEALMREILTVDVSLQTVFEREVFPNAPEGRWWVRRVPSYAARKFCREFKEAYNVKILPMSKFDDDVDAMKCLLAEGGELVDVFINVRRENWYVAGRPGLLFRACKSSARLPRSAMGALWSWASGELPDSRLRADINPS
ncbi:hypothetical protein [Streptomyces sp. NPDC057623]|uniref:hypothetical protein n=1 Tax=Streptomyces sp. NPDC057623 TaxID=3346187 RepID=UPI003691DB7A